MNSRSIIIVIFSIVVVSCNKHGNRNVNPPKPGGKEIAEVNTYLVEKDRERIKSYTERKNLSMQETKSGLWYLIEKPGSGETFRDRDRIVMDYKCYLLDGTLLYSSEKLGLKEIVLGRSEIEAGLNEGLRMLRPGGEAIFIIPPFLGYGLLGDNKAVPPRATLVYEIKISGK